MQRYYGQAIDSEGRGYPGASVTVKLAGTNTLATLYYAQGDINYPNPYGMNPITTDPLGNFSFAVANGTYDITVSGLGIPTKSYFNVTISDSASYAIPDVERVEIVATAGQTLFVGLPTYTPGTDSLMVFQNGTLLTPVSDYSETTSNSITLTLGASAGDQMAFVAQFPLQAPVNIYADFASQTTTKGAWLIGWMSKLTGAVGRLLGDKLDSLYVDVKDLGAKGDGTTDDITALNAAYAACIARGGGEIRLPRGYYRITSSWNIGAVPFDQFEFLLNRTDAVSDATANGHRIAGASTTNGSYRGRPITIVFEDGAYLVADFTPSVFTPVLGYYLDGDYRKSGGLVNPAVISKAMLSGGEYNFDAVSLAQTNKLIGIWYNHGCKVTGKAFVAGCQFGVASYGAFWTRGCDLYVAWAGGDCLNLAAANACEWDNLNFWNSARGIVYDGNSSTISGINCQGVAEEITVFACDGLQLGPGYLEDTSATDGTGKYAIKLGQAGGGTKVIGLRMFGLRNGSRRPNKKAMRIWDTNYGVIENCRVFSGTVDVDSTSYGVIIGGDFSSTTRIGKFIAMNNGVSFLYSSPPNTDYGVYGPWMFNVSGIAPGSIASGATYNYDYTLPAIANDWNNGGAFVTYQSGGNTLLNISTRLLYTTPKKVRIAIANPTAGAIDPGTFSLSLTVTGGI